MLFNIAAGNKDRAGKAFTTERTPKTYGYKQSAILTPKNKRLSYSYQIDIIDNTCIVCTVRHIDTQSLLAIVKLSNYTAESIEVEHGELYRNCSPYPYRREYNDKYLKKYDQIACIVHGAIASGLLFDTAEATTTEETSTTGQDTACTDTEPQRATEDASTAGSDTDHTEASQAPQKIVSDNAGEAANNMTAQDAQKAPQSEGTTAGGQTITAEGNEAQRATQSRKEAAGNAEPGRVSQSPAEAPQGQEQTAGGQRTTGTDTRPPRATERATTTPHRTRGAPKN